jgi:hypothetical protein
MYEPHYVPYVEPAKSKRYTPDFVLEGGIIIEAKGRFTAYDRAKHLLLKAQHPELDIRLVFQYDNKLSSKSKTRYSDWCNKHDIKYAIREVPEEWLAQARSK